MPVAESETVISRTSQAQPLSVVSATTQNLTPTDEVGASGRLGPGQGPHTMGGPKSENRQSLNRQTFTFKEITKLTLNYI